MASITLQTIDSFKSAGVYSREINKSQIAITSNDINRLVVGFSKKGVFNTPVYIPDTKTFNDVFGSDKALERKKSYFHRTVLTALEKGPVYVLNLLRLSDTDKVDNFIFSTASTEKNIGLNSQKFSGYYDTQKFWYPSDEAFLNNIKSVIPNSNRLFNLVNLDQKPLSVIVRKTPTSELNGFDVQAKEWYDSANFPEYLNPSDLISDFFVDVIVVGGNFGPDGSNGYTRFSTDPTFSKYFDGVKGIQRRKNASDLSDTSLEEFLSLQEVNVVATYRGILLPDFQDKNGNNMFIETMINNETAKTGLYCTINKDAFITGEVISGTIDGIDLVGHNIEFAKPNSIEFLSYKENIKSDLQFAKTTITPRTFSTISTTFSYNSAGNTVLQVSRKIDEALYLIAKTFKTNTLTPRVVGTYIGVGTLYSPVVSVVTTDSSVFIELGGRTDFTPLDNVGQSINYFDLSTDYFTIEDGTNGFVSSINSLMYTDILNGNVTTGDICKTGLNGTVPVYINPYLGTRTTVNISNVECTLTNNSYSIPSATIKGYETNDYVTLATGFNFSATYYTTAGVAAPANTLDVQSFKEALNQSVNVTTSLLPNEFFISYSDGSKISVNSYIVSDDGSTSGSSRLTKVYRIVNTGTNLKVTTRDKVLVKTVNSQAVVEVYKQISDWVDYYTIANLNGFKHTAYHLPDGTNEQQNNILYDTLNGTALYNALIDTENIAFRYVVDTFGNGIESSSKQILAKISADRGDCFTILNAPSYKEFKNSTVPSFVDLYGNVSARYISMGGDLSKNPDVIYSLPATIEGATYCGFFGPYIKVKDGATSTLVPPAGYVSNLFIQKQNTGFAWDYVAGPRRGVITGTNVIGLETNLSKEDRDYLEPFGINSIIFQPEAGIMIYSDKTADQKIRSALSSIHCREVVIHVRTGLEAILKRFTFELNTATTRLQISSLATNFLKGVMNNDGIYDFRVRCDETNNTPDIIDRNACVLDVAIEPVKGLEVLVSNITILRTGGISAGDFK